MPILLRWPDYPEVRIVTAFELPLRLKTKAFAAIPAARVNLISVNVFVFKKPGCSAAKNLLLANRLLIQSPNPWSMGLTFK